MDYVSRMHIQDTSKGLIHEILYMLIRKSLFGVYYSMQVGLHEIRDDVDVFVPRTARWFLNIEKGYDIIMIKITQESNFSKNSLSID